MIEKAFKKNSARQLLQMHGLPVPSKINTEYVIRLIQDRVLSLAGGNYLEAVQEVEALRENSKLLLFPKHFRVNAGDSNFGIKSLDDLLKIDSQRVLREITYVNEKAPFYLTKEFAEKHRVLPYSLLEIASRKIGVEKPPIGFYWIGNNGQARVITWLRATAGAEMVVMKRKGDFKGNVIDKKPYGSNLRVMVNSRTERDKGYEFSLFRLPMYHFGDVRQYSGWMNISHNSSDPDASYRGGEHNKRVNPIILWSAPTIFAFYESMGFVSENPEWKQFRVNPFPIPKDEKAIDFIDNLRFRSFILHKHENRGYILETLNQTEIERIVGARTGLRGYDACWRHLGKKDPSYLYKKN